MHVEDSTFDVAAAPEHVWEVLTRIDDYPDWNPQITSASGDLQLGGRLDLRLSLPGRPAMNVTATIDGYEAGRLLTWHGNVLADWFFKGERRFEITDVGDGTSRVRHLERITGALSPVFSLLMGEAETASHQQLNDAIRERAQAVTAD